MQFAIELDGVEKTYGKQKVLDGLSFKRAVGRISCRSGLRAAARPQPSASITSALKNDGGSAPSVAVTNFLRTLRHIGYIWPGTDTLYTGLTGRVKPDVFRSSGRAPAQRAEADGRGALRSASARQRHGQAGVSLFRRHEAARTRWPWRSCIRRSCCSWMSLPWGLTPCSGMSDLAGTAPSCVRRRGHHSAHHACHGRSGTLRRRSLDARGKGHWPPVRGIHCGGRRARGHWNRRSFDTA